MLTVENSPLHTLSLHLLPDKTGLSNGVSKPDGNQGKVAQKPFVAILLAVLEFNGEYLLGTSRSEYCQILQSATLGVYF